MEGIRSQWIFWLLASLLVVNLVFLARAARMLVFTGEVDEIEMARKGAYVLADFYRKRAAQKKLDKNQAVRDTLARFSYEVAQAVSTEEIGAVLDQYGLALKTVLDREEENLARQGLVEIVSRDPGVKEAEGSATVILRTEEDGRLVIEDPGKALSEETKEKLKQDERAKKLTGIMEIRVVQGRAVEVTARSLEGQLTALRQENQQIRSLLSETMQKSGFAALTGPGIVVEGRVSQESDNAETTLGYDVRDMVNELFAAGARGIEIGGQRLVATSSIRSAADRLLVNGRMVAVDPLVIKAVGDPGILTSSLDLIKNAPYFSLELRIKSEENVTLSAYK